MTEAEFLDRMDRHLAVANEHAARGSEHMARGNEVMSRLDEAFERNREALDRNSEMLDLNVAAFERSRQEYADTKRFMTGLSDRHERVARSMIREINDLNAATRRHTEALARIFDRLQGLGPAT